MKCITSNKKIVAALIYIVITVMLFSLMTDKVAAVDQTNEKTPNMIAYDDILNNRSYVEDTFKGNSFPDNNPYAAVWSKCGEDYMYKDFINNYENDKDAGIYRDGVNVYYRIEHLGEDVTEIPSALLDMFSNDADGWASFVKGAKNKSYENVLNGIYATNYTSESGMSLSSDIGDFQYLRTAYDYAKNAKKALKYGGEGWNIVESANTFYQQQMIADILPKYSDDIYQHVDTIDEYLTTASNNARREKGAFDSLFEARYYSMFKSEDEADIEWTARLNDEKTCKHIGKTLKYLKIGTSFIGGTIEKTNMLESFLRQRESLYGPLYRVRKKVEEDDCDRGFLRVSSRYLDLMKEVDEEDALSDSSIQALKATLLAFSDEMADLVDSCAKDVAEDIVKEFCVSYMVGHGAAKEATTVFIAEKLSNLAAIIEFLTNIGDLFTGFGSMCEKTYETQYLLRVRDYAIPVYEADKQAYLDAKKSGASTEELDQLAKNALDDLFLLKQLTLRANDLGYKTAKALASSGLGRAVSWFSGCNDLQDLEDKYNRTQGILIDTTISPIPYEPITVNEGQTLEIVKTDKQFILTRTGGGTFYFAEPEKRLLGGVYLNGGTLEVINRTDEDIYISSIRASGVGGTISLEGTGDTVTSMINVSGFSSVLKIESDTGSTLTTTRIENTAALSVKNITMNVENDMRVPADSFVSLVGTDLEIGGDLYIEGYDFYQSSPDSGKGFRQDKDSTLKVSGNIETKNTYTMNDSVPYIAYFGGEVELKGDLIDSSIDYYGWAGMNLLRLTGDRVQKISVRNISNYDVNLHYNCINKLEMTCPGIEVTNSLFIGELMSDLLVTSDIKCLCIEHPVEGHTIKVNGSVDIPGQHYMTTIGTGSLLDCDGDLSVTGPFVIQDGGKTKAGGNVSCVDGCIYMKASEMEVQGDLYVEGHDYIHYNNYTSKGFQQDEDSVLKVSGNIETKNTYTMNDSVPYIAYFGGEVELKGNLIDSSIDYYGWAGMNLLRLTGDRVQKISVRNISNYDVNLHYNCINKLEMACPGIEVTNSLFIGELMSDLLVTSDIKCLCIEHPVEGHTIKVNGSVDIPGQHYMTTISTGSLLDCDGDLSVTGPFVIQDGGKTKAGGNVSCVDGCIYMKASEMEVQGNLYVEGHDYIHYNNYTSKGFQQDEDSVLKVSGNIETKNTYTMNDSVPHIAYFGGEVELKGDLIDSSKENCGWYSIENLNLTGQKIQTITNTSENYNRITNLDSRGRSIKVQKIFYAKNLLSDITIVDSDPSKIKFDNWNLHTVKLNGTNVLPEANLSEDYGLMVEKTGDTYSVTYEPKKSDTYWVKYYIEGSLAKSIYKYENGSLVFPYERMIGTSDAYGWYSDQGMTEIWNLDSDTVTGNTSLFGVNISKLSELRSQLESLLDDARKHEESHYTDLSYERLSAAIDKAEEAISNGYADETVLNDSISQLQSAIDNLECAHDYQETAREDATCTNDGTVTYTCAWCNDSYVETIVSNGHTWNENYTVDQAPTETAAGSKSIHCSVCGALKEGSSVSIDKLIPASPPAPATDQESKPATDQESDHAPATPTDPSEGRPVTLPEGTVTVTSAAGQTVAFTKAPNKTSVTVPATVTINGKKYSVTEINANAFKGKKIRTVTIGKNVKKIKKNAFKGSAAAKLIVKTKKLRKATVKGSLKGSKVKTIQVKVGKKVDNKKYVKTYKKIFTKANAGKKVTIK